MNERDKSSKELLDLQAVLQSIVTMLQQEQENNWIHAFEKMQQKTADAIAKKLSAGDAVAYVRDIFNSIYRGNGSFSDFCIWRDDFDQRMALNQQFEMLVNRLKLLIQT